MTQPNIRLHLCIYMPYFVVEKQPLGVGFFYIIFYYIQNCEYLENLNFKIMFRWFRESETKFEKNI